VERCKAVRRAMKNEKKKIFTKIMPRHAKVISNERERGR
jgi:hypothetical protein